MKKIDKNFRTYSLSLLLVAIFFIAIGGISLSRNAVKDDNKIFQNFNAKEKVAVLSDENLRLDTENSELSKENENLKSNLERAKKSIDSYECVLKAYDFITQEDFENAEAELNLVLPDELSESALKMYNNLLNIIKENTNG